MAESSFAMDSADFTTLADQTANDASEVDDNITQVIADFNALIETATGHYHDGTGSRLIFGGIVGMTTEEFAVANIMGGI